MARVELQVEPWQEHVVQVMVLLSFTMQLVLLALADFRRYIDSRVLRAVIWSAYMLADTTATYTLGHMSVTSRSGEHELMAFWAPFLLLHLGGQDNITAYAIEDNRLWLRHLQALAVQVAAAAYILYESTIVGTQALLRNASFLMFVLGVLKYGERVWALKRAGNSASGNYEFYGEMVSFPKGPPPKYRQDTEGLLQVAHLLIDVPKNMLQGPLPTVMIHLDHLVPADEVYKVVEMQLSLMHDIVYSKAEVIHTWHGLSIRIISPVFTAVAFVLFHRSGLSAGDHHYSRADVVITYVLLGGAVMLETISVLRAMFSSVILWKLGKRRMWCLLARAITSTRRFVLPERGGSRWWWSDSMGQHNLIDLCIGSRASRASRIMGWMGVEDRWNTMVYSSSVLVSTTIKGLVVKQVRKISQRTEMGEDVLTTIIDSWGRAALRKWDLYEKLKPYVEKEFDVSILVWHIATDIYLRWYKDQRQAAADDVRCLAEATEAISNYMLFLLAVRPYMLPGSVSRTTYVDMCYCLTGLKYSTSHDLVSVLTSKYYMSENIKDDIERGEWIRGNDTLHAAYELARELISLESGTPAELEMITEVWIEMLCYVGYRCSGGELLTVFALVVEYYKRNVLTYYVPSSSGS